MDSVSITIVLPPYETELNSLPETYIRDIFSGYSLSMSGLSRDEQIKILTKLSFTRKTFPYLKEVVESNRHPRTVMLLSSKVGMYIPPCKREGLIAYKFYLSNIKYYEEVLQRPSGIKPPSLYDIFMAKDRINFLMKYKDNEILRSGFRFSRNYHDRRKMIEKFISENILVLGEFSLGNNSRTSYSGKARVIHYTDTQQVLSYSAGELLKLFDFSRRVLWKNSQGFSTPREDLAFNRLSLLYFRQQILEKFGQWRQNNCFQTNVSVDLYQILTGLESILSNEIRNDAGAYLGTPQLIL